MALKIPQNQIIFKYTSGGEYVIAANPTLRYQGYYYEVNGKAYTGKEYNVSGSVLLEKENNQFNNTIYNNLLNTSLPNKTSLTSVPMGPLSENILETDINIDFYCKKININTIKKIDEDSYLKLQLDPLYLTAYVGYYKGKNQSLVSADKIMPGLIDWVTFSPNETEIEPGE
jgi:hypothetical protein